MTESQADSFPKTIAVAPLSRPVDCEVQVPGSKSITNRALIIASLASPIDQMSTVLSGALRSEDTEVMVDGLQRLGF